MLESSCDPVDKALTIKYPNLSADSNIGFGLVGPPQKVTAELSPSNSAGALNTVCANVKVVSMVVIAVDEVNN